MFNKKIRKLMRDPKLFFSDMAIKRRNSFDILKPKENNGHYQYTIVSAVYNVGRYLDEYITSVTKQRLDFRKHIQLILVDDGSTDDSATIINKWQKKHPNNIHYFYKENGGQASARNLGMQYVNTEWVTFIDPDDFIDPAYFFELDNFLYKNKHQDLRMVCSSLVFYHESKKQFADAHPLKYKFSAEKVLTKNKLDTHFQLSASSAIFRMDDINETGLIFDGRIKPNFEDGHFIGTYLAKDELGSVGFVPSSKYYYRKREDGSSTLDTSWQKEERYGAVLEYGYLALLKSYQDKFGFIPDYIQNAILYDLMWHFKRIVSHASLVEFLSEEKKENYIALIDKIFTYIDTKTILDFNLAGCWFYHKIGMLTCFKKASLDFQIVYVQDYDSRKQQVLLSYFCGNPSLETISINGRDIYPDYTKTIENDFIHRSFVLERRLWVPLDESGVLKVNIANLPTRISFSGKQHRNGVQTKEIEKFFLDQRPKYHVTTKYSGAWLLMDRDTQADDNAEHLYRYIRNNHPEQKIYFVLRSESHDWQRLEQDGFQLLAFGESEHEAALKSCDKVISSHADRYVSNYLGPRMLDGRHFVFLQHGVIKDDLSGWLNQKERIDCFITASAFEYASIAADNTRYKFSNKEVALTGLPRHDALHFAKTSDEKTLLIMPTWRRDIVGQVTGDGNTRLLNPDFMDTTFARHWHSLLHSQRLADMCHKHGFKVVFFPHSNIQPYLNFFKLPDYIEVLTHVAGSIQDLFCNSTLMLTDYSSVAFEMAYLEKPTLYYQFDEAEVFSGGHIYERGYFDYRLNGFGPVAVEESHALDELEVLLQRDGQPDATTLHRMQETFPYRDGKCCERVYQAIVALDAPRNPETVNLPVLLDYAEQASKAKIWPLAERRWSQLYALMDEAHHSAACLGLATSLRNQGKISEAWCHFDEYEARQAMHNQPLIGEALAEKAELLMAGGNWEQATQIWAELQLSGEGYIPTRHLHCQLAMEDWAGVSQQISSPAFSLLSMHEQICCTAVIDSAKGEWQQVIEQLSEAIMQFTPDELRTLKPELLLAQAYRELGDFDAAHQQLLGYEKHTKSDSACRQEIALLAFARGDFTKAHKQLAQAFPDRNDLPLSLAATYLKSLRKAKQLNLAIDMAVWLRANHQTDVNIMTEAGKIALMAKQWEMTADIWPSLIGVLDDAPYKLALALRMLGDIESAQKYLDDSNTRLPCCMDEWILKAETAQLNGRWQQAAMCWRELLRLYPSHAPSYCWDRMQSALLLANSGTISPVYATH
ncbi:CDP-glycerol glycerophosphotransferase family protein [Aeromonas caviae]